jgi:hypothetical protein
MQREVQALVQRARAALPHNRGHDAAGPRIGGP